MVEFATMQSKPGPGENSNLRWISIAVIIILAFLAGWYARPVLDKRIVLLVPHTNDGVNGTTPANK